MATIEERAREYATNTICIKHQGKKVLAWEKFLQGCVSCDREKEAFEHYMVIATEQDSISRVDERDRCIKAACEIYCRDCGCCYSERMRLEKKQNCSILGDARKELEGGNNGN